MKILMSILSLSTLFALSFANTAIADHKMAPGSMCNASDGRYQDDIRTTGSGSRVHIEGKSDSNAHRWVKCPIVEDDMGGGVNNDFRVTVYLHHPSNRTTRCCLDRGDSNDDPTNTVCKSTTGKKHRTIQWSFGSSYSWQNSSLRCYLADGTSSTNSSAGATKLHSYAWFEQ